jgi:CheY-like chemotaxis protein/signal transduction histidine kinase
MLSLKSPNVDESIMQLAHMEGTEISELWLAILDLKHELEEKLHKSETRLKLAQKESEASRKNSETKSLFLAKMSHELRTPMNGLLGFSSLLLESKLDDEQREYAQTIQVSLESLLYVVNDVLDLSRIESGDLMITTIPFNLRGVLSGVNILLKNRAESKGLVFESRISPDIPQTLRGDPVRIRQVLMNLVANSIQHTDKGHVLVNVDLLALENSRAVIRLSIEDSGSKPIQRITKQVAASDVGFSSELRDKRSLGLDICYQLVELMGSSLLNQSKEENGSTYWFELSMPVVREDNSRELLDLSLLKTLKVLVIDSYELSRKITLELLSEWGIQFEAVGTVGDAVKTLQSFAGSDEQFNMVLCDDILQDLSGLEACQMIRQSVDDPVQIVVLCSNPQLGDAENFFLAGACGFLSKQFRDPFLRGVMCQAYAERFRQGSERRLVTRYTVSDAENEPSSDVLDVELEKKANILIVEDNIVNQQLVMRMLERNGCQVDLAVNGFEAIELFKKNKYALIFMDCLMPEMDGYETTQIIRDIEKSKTERGRTPIVALTANAYEEEAERCFQVGMDEFMTKPFKIAQLEMVLERYIN